jgi:hypothetical protein
VLTAAAKEPLRVQLRVAKGNLNSCPAQALLVALRSAPSGRVVLQVTAAC